MAPAALRSGWVGAITQATTCLKIIGAFRIGRANGPSNRSVECPVESVGRMPRRIGRSNAPSNQSVECPVESVGQVWRRLIFERREKFPRVDPPGIPCFEGREMVGVLDEELCCA